MRALRTALAIVAVALAAPMLCQVTFPDCYIQNWNWTSGAHHYTVPQPLYSPGDPNAPVSSTGTANTEFVSATQVRLTPGFHAGDLSGEGRFRAHINTAVGDPDDLVVITPDASQISDGVLHVNKWEKLELGYRLPQTYRDAIQRFFTHYYSNGLGSQTTPDSVSKTHDLNPYADDSLQLVMTLTSPSGQQRMQFGFYMKQAHWQASTPLAKLAPYPISPLAPYNIRFRFAPDEEGLWQFALSIVAPHTSTLTNSALATVAYSGYSFVCDDPLPDNHGPLHVDTLNHRMLRFEDGTAFFGLGTNMADIDHGSFGEGNNDHWWTTYFRRDFDVMLETMEQLRSVGGNFLRMYLMPHIFAPELVNLGVYDQYTVPGVCANGGGWTTGQTGNGQYQSWAFDQMLDSARAKNIYIQLCMDPYPPIIDYEFFHWGAHSFVQHFLEPARQQPPLNPYNMREFFYLYGDPIHKNTGVFYYWKRKYKYMMARWGYSVNLPIVEPFNEIDQMLSYRALDLTTTTGATCEENKVNWQQDTGLPGVISTWVADIADFVRGEVEPSDPVHSPLGLKDKLFLMSYAKDDIGDVPFYLPFANPAVDLLDVHKGLQEEWNVRNGFDATQAYRDTYPSNGRKKPFHQGEFTTYGHKIVIENGDTTDYGTSEYFNNYNISFHNELWASAFSGSFAAGTSWGYNRVFWWPDGLEKPPPDAANTAQLLFPRNNTLDSINVMFIPGTGVLQVPNKRVHHQFKPLSNLLNHPNWQAYGFFEGDFSAHRQTIVGEVPQGTSDEERRLECYWLLREPQRDLAIGWVHNLNAYWGNSWYVKSQFQNMLGCDSPDAQSITLPGFAAGEDYFITYIPTWMNDTVCPVNDTITWQTGNVVLDLSSAPLHGQVGSFLDTLHSDYAFVVATVPFVKNRHLTAAPIAAHAGWDFGVYPNPAADEVYVSLPDDKPRDITLLDLLGRQVRVWRSMKGPTLALPLSQLATGTYWIRASDGASNRTKKLIVQ